MAKKKTQPRRAAQKRTSKAKPAKAGLQAKKKASRKAKASRAPARRVGVKSRKAASKPEHDFAGMLGRVFDRIRPLLRRPIDPRVKQLVEVFGLEAVAMLMDVARRKLDQSHRAELIEALNALHGRPAPLPHGSWIWHELMTTDVAASRRFYRELFGWQPQDVEMMPGFNYTTFANNGTDVGGMMAIAPEHGEMSSGWGVYVKVDDVDAAAEKAESLGGEIIVPAHDIPVGRWAMVKDPGGATICLFRAKV